MLQRSKRRLAAFNTAIRGVDHAAAFGGEGKAECAVTPFAIIDYEHARLLQTFEQHTILDEFSNGHG